MSSSIVIEQVTDPQGLGRFIRFPWAVYESEPNWAPPLVSEMEFLLGDGNPFFRHAEAAWFLAVQDGTDVGRIGAIIDRNHINFHNEQTGFFGFYEAFPDLQVAEALLGAAGDWLRSRAIEVMRGPVNPSTNDECGFLVDGHDRPPMIMMPYTPPYYLDQMESCGMAKARDLLAYLSSIRDVASVGRLEKVAAGVRRRLPGLAVRPIDRKRFPRELGIVKDIYNSAWSRNWGFVPMTDEEIDSMARRLKPLIVPELVLIAELDGQPAGFLMTIPDYNQVLRRLNGRLGVLGALRFLWYRRSISDVRVMTLGIKEKHRRRGIEALLYLEAFRAALRKGYRNAEMSWVLEDNILMQRGCELMGGKLTKRYRVFEKRLAP